MSLASNIMGRLTRFRNTRAGVNIMAPLARQSLGRKIGLLTLAALIIGLGLFSILALQSVNASTDRTLQERLGIAQIVADRLDQTLNYILVELRRAASFPSGFPTEQEFGASVTSLRRVFRQQGIGVDTIYVLDASGSVVMAEPPTDGILGFPMSSYYQDIRTNLAAGTPGITGLVSKPLSDAPTVLMTIPIIDGDTIVGALVSSVDVESFSVGVLGKTLPVGETGYAEFVDVNGVVVARTGPGTPPGDFELSDHPTRFAELIQTGQATVGKCHRCHSVEEDARKQRDVLAFAPLSAVPWGVAIRQSEAEALQPTRQLETRLLFVGGILVFSTLGLVVTLMQNIVKPIRMLTTAADRLAVNDYEATIPSGRGDEIGQLSTAFESMRGELQRSRREMVNRYEEAKRSEELRGQLLNSVIEAQEQERRRIARELHDEYGQTLTGLIMSIDSVETSLPPEHSRLKDKLSGTKSVINHALDDMRRLILDLRPPSLDELGLVTAINTMAQRHLGDLDINVEVESHGINGRFPQTLEVTVFRIVQEAVHNVAKHAGAHNVKINLAVESGKLLTVIEDDGKGFDVESVLKSEAKRHAWGIVGMRERVALMGGTFRMDSTRGKGTRLNVEIPIDSSRWK